jgi:hypothetical protein
MTLFFCYVHDGEEFLCSLKGDGVKCVSGLLWHRVQLCTGHASVGLNASISLAVVPNVQSTP